MSFTSNAFRGKQLFEGSLAAFANRAWAWYKSEFCALFPPDTLAWLLDRGDRKLLLRLGARGPELHFTDTDRPEAPIPARELVDYTVETALARRGIAREAAKITLQMPRAAFFVRSFEIPAAAEANLAKLIIADIERKTPFHVNDVVYGYKATRRADVSGKTSVRLWLLRRDILAGVIENSGLYESDLDAVTAEPDGAEAAPIIALDRRDAEQHWFRNMATGLAGAAVALFVIGVAGEFWRQDRESAQIDARIAEVSVRAGAVRKIADQAVAQSRMLTTMQEERKRGPAFDDIWEEVSRVLPDGAYLTELRVSETKNERFVDLIGFADSAVGLPALFDKSPMFTESSLTAPITPNAQERREAFSLRTRVKQQELPESK